MSRFKIIAPHRPVPGHFFDVREEMFSRGAPRIRCYALEPNFYIALEGSHRLAVANSIRYVPELEVLALGDLIEDHDFTELQKPATVKQILDFLATQEKGPVYEFEIGGEDG